jgi:hypothetical protein
MVVVDDLNDDDKLLPFGSRAHFFEIFFMNRNFDLVDADVVVAFCVNEIVADFVILVLSAWICFFLNKRFKILFILIDVVFYWKIFD